MCLIYFGGDIFSMVEQHRLEELAEISRRLYRKIGQEWSRRLERDVSGSQLFILELLESHGRLRASELAEMLGITSGAVTGLCDKLIAGKYAGRRRTEEDRRVVYVEITPEGKELLCVIKAQRIDITRKFYNGLSDEDVGHLIRIYQQVLGNLK